jgi:NADH/F420H2 dehydrogenase subunit C
MTRDELKQYLDSNLSEQLSALDTGRYDLLYEVKAEKLVETARALVQSADLRFDYLCNMGGVDTGERFEIVYSLASIELSHRLDIKVVVPYESPEVDSVQEIWPGANWFEREVWELYGINIKNHNDLKRFLLPDDWDQGHPMRKNWDAPDFVRMPEK